MAHCLVSCSSRPKMIVFDLDYTLWQFYVDCNATAPFKAAGPGLILDKYKTKLKCYSDVPEILETLKKEKFLIGVASRSPTIERAKEAVKAFGWDKYFDFVEIYPGTKTVHFSKIKKNSGIEYSDMLFFDDESRNIHDLTNAGVVSVLVDDGVNFKVLNQGLQQYASQPVGKH